jgi:hypothetical protein
MYLTTTNDDGQTFAPATKLGRGTWMLSACPMDGGMVAATDGKNPMTAWRRENSVYVSATSGAEIFIGAGKQPWTAFGPDGLFAVWWGREGINLWTAKTSRGTNLSPQGGDPVVSSSPDHKIVVAAWTNEGIQSARLTP